jgi:hypothetical protein
MPETNRGGARPGSGRKRRGRVKYALTLRPETVARLNAAVSNGQRSEFIELAIVAALDRIATEGGS